MNSSVDTDDATKAVAYVRASTDQQDLSIGTQLALIQTYADSHQIQVVHVYEDAAKSGLGIAQRQAMKSLLADVMKEPRGFDLVLVYDVSRWGRFQDADAAAYYEYTCRLYGARVVYVGESFGAETEPMSALLKAIKRVMAAEYSRELGVKCRAGQDRAIALGYQMGHLPCLGLRRVAVEQDGTWRDLPLGRRKSLQNERIKWAPASDTESALVRRIFSMYVAIGGSIKGTALALAAEGVRSQSGRLLTPSMVDGLLRCEALAGNFAWGVNRHATRIERGKRPASRAVGVIEPVVPRELWDQVQAKLWHRRRLCRGKEQLLQLLRDKLRLQPTLTVLDLEAAGIQHKKAFTKAFGSVSRALELAGRSGLDVEQAHAISRVRGMRVGNAVVCDIRDLLHEQGIPCSVHPRSRMLTVGGQARVRVQLTWPRMVEGNLAWHVLKNKQFSSDAVLLVRMTEEETAACFYLLSYADYKRLPPWLRSSGPESCPALHSTDELVSSFRQLVKTQTLATCRTLVSEPARCTQTAC